MKGEGSQQQKVAGQRRGREKVESATRRIRRFVDNARFPMRAFWTEWVGWVVKAIGSQQITLLVDETKLHDRLG